MADTVTHTGGCHCGAVRFDVIAPAAITAYRCNCSICLKSGFLALIVPANSFRLVSGEGQVATYRFNTGVAKHTFCKVCGVKSFYTPRSRPDGVSVNVLCLDPGTVSSIDIKDFDGQHWEASMAANPPAI